MSKSDIVFSWFLIVGGGCGFLEFLVAGNYLVVAYIITGIGIGVSAMRLLSNRSTGNK